MKKILAVVLALLMVLSLAGCSLLKGNTDEGGEFDKLWEENQKLREEIEALKNKAPEVVTEDGAKLVFALQSTIDGEKIVVIEEKTELTAKAVLEEGMVVDHWKLNGEEQKDSKVDEFTFTAEDFAIIEAFVRPEKKVTTINAEMRFLNKNGKPDGDPFTEFVFEEPYTNPLTDEEIKDGTITVQVKAVVPKGYAVDYWKINDVPYHFNNQVISFIVENLDEATVYEVVLKEIEVQESKPQQSSKPSKVEQSEPEESEEYEDPFEGYYKVECIRCNFPGAKSTSSWTAEGKVKAGTTITVTCNSGLKGNFYVTPAGGKEEQYDKWGITSTTITINSDMVIDFYEIIN